MLRGPRRFGRRSDTESEKKIAAEKEVQVLGRRKAGRNQPRHRPIEAKTNFNKFKVVGRGKDRINPAVEGVQRHFCIGLQ